MAAGVRLTPPAPLNDQHQLGEFDCADAALNDWLKQRARRNQINDASRTYVVCAGDRVIAYYALASGAVANAAATGRFGRNMPNPIPVAVLGRLAIDRAWQGQGIGRALVADAARRALVAGAEIGIRGLLVHAANEDAQAFYLRVGFAASPLDKMTLMLTMNDVRKVDRKAPRQSDPSAKPSNRTGARSDEPIDWKQSSRAFFEPNNDGPEPPLPRRPKR